MVMATRREFLGSLALAAASGVVAPGETTQQAQIKPVECGSSTSGAMAVVSKYKAVFTKPPTQIPFKYRVDAPLLGNGDMLAALSGAAEYPQLWVTLNDFW